MRAQATIAVIAFCLLGVASSVAAPAEEPHPLQNAKEVASLEKRIAALEAQNAKLLAVVKISGSAVTIEGGTTLQLKSPTVTIDGSGKVDVNGGVIELN